MYTLSISISYAINMDLTVYQFEVSDFPTKPISGNENT